MVCHFFVPSETENLMEAFVEEGLELFIAGVSGSPCFRSIQQDGFHMELNM